MIITNQKDLQKEAEKASDPAVDSGKDEKPDVSVRSYSRGARRTKQQILDSMEHEKKYPEAPETLEVEGRTLTFVEWTLDHTEAEYHRAYMTAIDYMAPVYKDKGRSLADGIKIRDLVPDPLIPGSLLSPSLASFVITNKFEAALPMNRQIPMLNRIGFTTTRATLCNWMTRLDELYFSPLFDRLVAKMRETNVVHADETPWQVHRIPDKENTSQSRCWAYCTGKYEKFKIVIMDFEPNRNGDNALDMLAGFTGCAMTDGFSGYNKLVGDIIRCACWAHNRRYWKEAIPSIALSGNNALKGFEYCNRIFSLEKTWIDCSPEERLRRRQKELAPIMDEFFAWAATLRPMSGSALEKAVTYTLNQEAALREVLKHGDVELSNNMIESLIKVFVIGRKNWLFSDSPEGAKATGHIYSLVLTAKKNGLDVYDYIREVLERLRWMHSKPTTEQLDELLPWSDAMQAVVKKAA